MTTQFKKDYKQAVKRHLDISLLDDIIRALSRGETLPEKNKDHSLSSNWAGHRECHILPDWLLIYHIHHYIDRTGLNSGTDSAVYLHPQHSGKGIPTVPPAGSGPDLDELLAGRAVPAEGIHGDDPHDLHHVRRFRQPPVGDQAILEM